ncbi:MAG: hypothetical protein JWO84_598 [Parcubacteria group bacterium]|nr:hypothetical protein [Parcubacteria group bacterium]
MKRFITLALLGTCWAAYGNSANAATITTTQRNGSNVATCVVGTMTVTTESPGGLVNMNCRGLAKASTPIPAKTPPPATATAAPAVATLGKQHPFYAFCKGGVPSKDELVRRMRKSLDADRNGMQKLEGCHANPVQFLEAFRQGDPEAGLTHVSQLVVYIDGLVEMTPDRDTVYYSSCVMGKTNGPEDVKPKCQPQKIAAGVKVYGNPKTHRMTLKLDCANPGLVPVAPPSCDLIVFEVRREGEHRSHHPVYGPAEDATCHGYQKVALTADGGIRLLGDRGEFAPGCLDRMPSCSYEGADAAARPRVRTFDGTIDALKPGFYAVRVSHHFSTNVANALGICVEFTDPETGEWTTSFTAIVRTVDYKTRPNGQRVARVAYQENELPAGVRENDPGGLYLWPAR